ncbi:hypothetical protein HQQ80_19440 [Microbacteriaceae bacterium VKM Ac-2855]|nr:hypothetical protein [Microbacteriaceae bacterium VKM Ac-2855]
MTTDFDPDQIIRDATAGLKKKFPNHDEEQLRQVVREELAALQDRPVQDYLSVLTERAARQRIKAADKANKPGKKD